MLTVMMLGVPSPWEGICGLKPAQGRCSPWNSFVSCLIFIPLCWAEPCVHSLHAGLANSGRNIYITSWFTQLTYPFMYSKGHPLVPFVLRKSQLLCSSHGQWHPVLLSELHDIALAHFCWDFFHCRGSLVSHKALALVVGLHVCAIVESWKCLTWLLQSTPCYFWGEIPNAVSSS